MRRALVVVVATLAATLSIVVSSPAGGATQQFLWYDQEVTHTERSYAEPTQSSATPPNWTSPVDYVNGRVYTRFQVLSKPSTKPLDVQICVWRDSYKQESCSPIALRFSTTGVYYVDFGVPNNWWKKPSSPAWTWTTPFNPTRFMIKDPNTGKLLMTSACGASCSTTTAVTGHVPIKLDVATIVIAKGATLAPPSNWTGCPWPGCSTTSTTTTAPTSTTTTTTTSSGKKVAMIVGNASKLPPKDGPIRSRLVNSLGRQVVLVDDDNVTSSALTGAGLVLVSSSVVPSKIPSWLAGHGAPVLNTEAYAQARLKMASSPSELAGKTSLEMRVPSTDPMAAGKSGTVAVQTSAPIGTGTPVASATIVARVPGTTGASIYRIPAGGALTTGTAPAKRVGFFFSYDSPPLATSNGWALFDAAVKWLAP